MHTIATVHTHIDTPTAGAAVQVDGRPPGSAGSGVAQGLLRLGSEEPVLPPVPF